MISTFGTLLLFISIIWLAILTFFTVRFYIYYSHITRDGKKNSLLEVISDAVQVQKQLEKTVFELHKKYDTLEKENLLHIQKVGLLRFNPFHDTGGDQSFILALLDAHNTGVVISSLHTRSGTRWYAKKVMKGKGVEYDLSEDEMKALKESSFLSKV